jgi:hypothetical protein
VVINFLLLGLYTLFSKFNFISYLAFLGLIGLGIYFIIRKKRSRENDEQISELTLRKVKHMQNILKKEGLSNMTVKDEDLETFEDIPSFIRKNLVLNISLGEEQSKLSKFTISGKKLGDNTGDEFEDRVKIIMFELFEELTKELRSIESQKVHSFEPKIVKEIEVKANQDKKKLRELLTIIYEILGDDFFTDNYVDKNYKEFLDKAYMKTIKGKFKTHVLQNPTH